MNAEIIFTVPARNRWCIQRIAKDVKDIPLTVTVDKYKNKRSLDQNALMWALLTEYADGLNAGRKGDITPEELYYQALSKYGVAEYLLAVEEAEEMLKKTFRIVQKVDKRTVKGKTLTMFKCYYGSSTYDTKQMTDLIDGILDELAQAEIETPQTQYLKGEWHNAKHNSKA